MKFHPYSHPSPERIRHLNALFEQGCSSNSQERELFAAFAPGRPLPPDLEPLRPLMQMYAAMAPKPRRKPMPIAIRWLSAGVAASLLAIVGWGYASHLSSRKNLDEMRRMYAGSYVIRNGVKYTDPAEIMADLNHAEQLVSRNSRAAKVATPTPSPIPDEIDMDDPAIRKVIESALSF